ncbi:hypothetical protein [Paracoccus nototheniae]|uniref:Uncharacterized protein n=1 Tax=Paracoccus nototheniae TaxID=2489002 RepID=A0ABW4E4B5_9RHOB|nr:hypothetical protein [Paracoccus nototheniae]
MAEADLTDAGMQDFMDAALTDLNNWQ